MTGLRTLVFLVAVLAASVANAVVVIDGSHMILVEAQAGDAEESSTLVSTEEDLESYHESQDAHATDGGHFVGVSASVRSTATWNSIQYSLSAMSTTRIDDENARSRAIAIAGSALRFRLDHPVEWRLSGDLQFTGAGSRAIALRVRGARDVILEIPESVGDRSLVLDKGGVLPPGEYEFVSTASVSASPAALGVAGVNVVLSFTQIVTPTDDLTWTEG